MITWKPLYDYKNYEISNTGLVRSLTEDGLVKRNIKQRNNGKEPHLFFEVYSNKKKRTIYTHKAVMEHFGKPPRNTRNGMQRYVEHIDGVYTHNEIENLRWITHYQLYYKQIATGKRKHKLDLYRHSPRYQKSLKQKASSF